VNRLIAAVLAVVLIVPAFAAEATCNAYLQARGEDRSLFDGYIYGYVMAKLENQGDAIVDSATLKVKEMTTAYCLRRPDDRATKVIATITDVVSNLIPR
jgi:hypothetical protein